MCNACQGTRKCAGCDGCGDEGDDGVCTECKGTGDCPVCCVITPKPLVPGVPDVAVPTQSTSVAGGE